MIVGYTCLPSRGKTEYAVASSSGDKSQVPKASDKTSGILFAESSSFKNVADFIKSIIASASGE